MSKNVVPSQSGLEQFHGGLISGVHIFLKGVSDTRQECPDEDLKKARKNLDRVLKKSGQSTVRHILEIQDGLEKIKAAITDFITQSKSTRLRARLAEADAWLEKIKVEFKKETI